MAVDRTVTWHGWGRWLAFVFAALLILYAIPLIFNQATGALAGWNIFLGLLMAGAVGSGYRHAPRIALGIALLMLVRLLVALVFVPLSVATLGDVLFVVLAAVIFWDLRRQAGGAA